MLITFFLLGYAFFLAFDTLMKPDLAISLLVSMILFFGAVFVVLVLRINHSILSDLNDHVDKLQILNRILDKRRVKTEMDLRGMKEEEEILLNRISDMKKKNVPESSEEMKAKIAELQQFQKIAVGRELRMVELKKKLKALEDKKAS